MSKNKWVGGIALLLSGFTAAGSVAYAAEPEALENTEIQLQQTEEGGNSASDRSAAEESSVSLSAADAAAADLSAAGGVSSASDGTSSSAAAGASSAALSVASDAGTADSASSSGGKEQKAESSGTGSVATEGELRENAGSGSAATASKGSDESEDSAAEKTDATGAAGVTEKGDTGISDATEKSDVGIAGSTEKGDAGTAGSTEKGDAGTAGSAEKGDAGTAGSTEKGNVGITGSTEKGDAGITASTDSTEESGLGDTLPEAADNAGDSASLSADSDASGTVLATNEDGTAAVRASMEVTDGTVHITLTDDGNGNASWAGPSSNGKYSITTDQGQTLVFELNSDGTISGSDKLACTRNGDTWEISIPVSELPDNDGNFSFGLYLVDDNRIDGHDSSKDGEEKSQTNIEYDGSYGDWKNYPVTEIQYSGSGTHENVPDGQASMYYDNNIYGYCETTMQAHLDEKGGEFTQAVSVLANNDWNKALYMRLAAVDGNGNINWNPQQNNLTNGTYEYYIFGTDAWGTSGNISNLNAADVNYGKMTVTIEDGIQRTEWYVDPAKLAARYGLSETDLKTVECQYGRIGQQLVETAGASTGPKGSAVIAGSAVLAALLADRKKRKG